MVDFYLWRAKAFAAEAEIHRLNAKNAADAEIQSCGHAAHWLAYRNPTSRDSERYCVFCEIERLRAKIAELVGLLSGWITEADAGKIDGVDLGLMVSSEELAEELRKAGEV